MRLRVAVGLAHEPLAVLFDERDRALQFALDRDRERLVLGAQAGKLGLDRRQRRLGAWPLLAVEPRGERLGVEPGCVGAPLVKLADPVGGGCLAAL